MAQQQSPWLEGAYGWNFGEGGWNSGMDQNLLKFSFMFDRNVDSVVASLPAAVNGQAHYLTTDNRLYFAVGTTYFSTPTPKWFEFKDRSTGTTYQFNGTSAVQIDSPAQLDSRLDAVELTVASLGTAAFESIEFFATQAELDVAVAPLQQFDADIGNSADTTKGGFLVGYKRSPLSAVINTVKQSLDGKIVNIWEYANLATGYTPGGDISTWDWRPAIQSALASLSAGETLHFPAPHIYRAVNATSASGTTIVERRADAVLNGTLFAVTSATNRIAIRVDGQINGTSALDDIFRLTGDHVTFCGQGTIRNVSGEFLDTNNQADSTVQWFPSLVRLEGNFSGSRDLTYYDAPTVGLNLRGDDNWADRNTFVGGLTAHGDGTILFGIYSGISNVLKFRHLITRNHFGRSAENGACYSGVFATSRNSVFAMNTGKSVLEHLIYSNGYGAKILHNDVDDAGLAAAYQSFGDHALIEGNRAINCSGGVQVTTLDGVRIIGNDFSEGISLSGIAVRTKTGAASDSVEYDVVIANNRVAVTGTQSPIDVAMTTGLRGLIITGNTVSGGPAPGNSGDEGNIRIRYVTGAAGNLRNVTISGNTHRDCAGYAIAMRGVQQFKIHDETIRNANGTTSDVAMRFFSCTNGEVYNNTVEDTRGTKLTARILFASTADGNSSISAHDNNGVTLLASGNALCAVPTNELGFNNHQDSLGNVGLFTMTAAASLVVDSAVSKQTTSIRAGATVVIEPLNKAAVDQQAGVKRLYVSAVAAGQFTVSTSDATAAVAATYTYRILQ